MLQRRHEELPQRSGRSIVVARSGTQAIDSTTGERSVILHDGYRYAGVPKDGYDVFHFDSMKIAIEMNGETKASGSAAA